MLPRPGQVQTVLGVIDGAELGITVPHEHLLFDGTSVFRARRRPRSESSRTNRCSSAT